MRIWTMHCKFWLLAALLAALPTLCPAALTAQAEQAEQTGERTVLVLGDSLSAGYGMAPEQGWVALLGQRLQARHPGWRVVNASISGETTGGGASRIAAALAQHQPDVVMLALGANDALRGLPLALVRDNLQGMIDAARGAGARLLLIGLQIPPNYGPDYADGFRALFSELAAQNRIALLPFLLEPIATDLSAFQADTIHPTAAVQPLLLEHVWPALEPLLAHD